VHEVYTKQTLTLSIRLKTQTLEPEWLAATLEAEDPVLSVDCGEDIATCQTYGVQSVPAIRLFRKSHGEQIAYHGPHRAGA